MRLYQRFQVFMLAILILVGFLTGAAWARAEETLSIMGTGSSIGTMKLMAKAFQMQHPLANIEVLPSIGSTGAIKAVREGKIDIGLSSRPLKPEERSAEIVEVPYGRTAFIFGVQDSNPVKGFTLGEIEEIYAGKLRTWPDGTPIRIILRPLSDAFSAYLAGINPGMKSASEKAHSISGLFVGSTDQEASAQIEKTPGSFGTTSSSLIKAEKLRIKALFVDGVAPTPVNVSTGKYPFVMTLSLVYKKDKYGGLIKDFMRFIFSREGQKLLAANGHVHLGRISRR